MKPNPIPLGQLRISEAVINKLTMDAVCQVGGIVDVHGLMIGAVIGGVVGGTVGLIEGGPIGGVLGATAGSAAGAISSRMLTQYQDRRMLYDVSYEHPPIHVKVSAVYGANLQSLALQVREEIVKALMEQGGISPGEINIEFDDVVYSTRLRRNSEYPT